MKCARCDRDLKRPSVVFGRYGMGRVCAEKAGLLKAKQRRPSIERDPKTMDWIEEMKCHG